MAVAIRAKAVNDWSPKRGEIHTKQAGLVERLGKFNRIAAPGLNFKLPFIESLVYGKS